MNNDSVNGALCTSERRGHCALNNISILIFRKSWYSTDASKRSCHHHISMSKIFWCDEFCLSELRASLCLSPYIFETPCWPLSPCPILDSGPNLNWTPGLGICQRHLMAALVLNERYKTRFLSKYASRAFELWMFVNIHLLWVQIKEKGMFLLHHIMILHRI